MASFFEEDLHSSDSEDDDYVPNQGEISSDDEDEEVPLPLEINDEIKTKKRSKKPSEKHSSEDEKKKVSQESPLPKDEKQRANDLFKNFLEEVEAEMKAKDSGISPGSSSDSPGALSIDSDLKSKGNANEDTAEKSCELFDFAGETVAVSVKDGIKISSAENSTNLEKNAPEKPENKPPIVKRKGLEYVLSAIMNKKQKLSTLDKTCLDWKSFKKEHEISEELETYNKGRGGYIERQRFLQRSDVRSYEIERDLRLSKGRKKC